MFSKINPEDWKRAASQEIEGQDPFQTLTWQVEDLSFLPIYHNSFDSELQYLKEFNLQPSQDEFTGARSWRNLPTVIASDELQANKSALNHLANGADGILVKIENEKIKLTKLLDNIEWQYCTISFVLTEIHVAEEIKKITSTLEDKNFTNAVLFWETLPAIDQQFASLITSQKNVKSIGFIIEPSTPTQEISEALFQAVQCIDALIERGIDKQLAVNAIAFSVPVGINFFIEIAKLKALRLLWFQIAQAYGVSDYAPSDLHIHARSESWVTDKFNPNSNMLKATTSAMAAVIGGCDSLTINAEDNNNPMVTRIARNVSNILREESHFDKVADPLAGAYAIESMVNQLAQKAWREFQHKSKAL